MALTPPEVALVLLPSVELLASCALPLWLLMVLVSSLLPLSVMLCTWSSVSSSDEVAAVEALALTLSTQPALASLTARLEASLGSEDAPTSSSDSLLLLVALAASVVAGELVAGVVVVGVFVVVAGVVVVGVFVVGVGVVVVDEELLEHVMASVSSV